MLVVKKDQDWVEEHAFFDELEEAWRCKTTRCFIQPSVVRRSLHDSQFTGLKAAGSGDVRLVTHLHCPSCNSDYKPPEHGTPIRIEELIDVT